MVQARNLAEVNGLIVRRENIKIGAIKLNSPQAELFRIAFRLKELDVEPNSN